MKCSWLKDNDLAFALVLTSSTGTEHGLSTLFFPHTMSPIITGAFFYTIVWIIYENIRLMTRFYKKLLGRMIKTKPVKTCLLSTAENAFPNSPANCLWVFGTLPLNMFTIDGRTVRKPGPSACEIHVSHLQPISQPRFTNVTDSMFSTFWYKTEIWLSLVSSKLHKWAGVGQQ